MVAKTAWIHRIDAVPRVGERIEFVHNLDDTPRVAVVINPIGRDDFYAGTGDDVRLAPEGGDLLLIPSKSYSYWRYV